MDRLPLVTTTTTTAATPATVSPDLSARQLLTSDLPQIQGLQQPQQQHLGGLNSNGRSVSQGGGMDQMSLTALPTLPRQSLTSTTSATNLAGTPHNTSVSTHIDRSQGIFFPHNPAYPLLTAPPANLANPANPVSYPVYSSLPSSVSREDQTRLYSTSGSNQPQSQLYNNSTGNNSNSNSAYNMPPVAGTTGSSFAYNVVDMQYGHSNIYHSTMHTSNNNNSNNNTQSYSQNGQNYDSSQPYISYPNTKVSGTSQQTLTGMGQNYVPRPPPQYLPHPYSHGQPPYHTLMGPPQTSLSTTSASLLNNNSNNNNISINNNSSYPLLTSYPHNNNPPLYNNTSTTTNNTNYVNSDYTTHIHVNNTAYNMANNAQEYPDRDHDYEVAVEAIGFLLQDDDDDVITNTLTNNLNNNTSNNINTSSSSHSNVGLPHAHALHQGGGLNQSHFDPLLSSPLPSISYELQLGVHDHKNHQETHPTDEDAAADDLVDNIFALYNPAYSPYIPPRDPSSAHHPYSHPYHQLETDLSSHQGVESGGGSNTSLGEGCDDDFTYEHASNILFQIEDHNPRPTKRPMRG